MLENINWMNVFRVNRKNTEVCFTMVDNNKIICRFDTMDEAASFCDKAIEEAKKHRVHLIIEGHGDLVYDN